MSQNSKSSVSRSIQLHPSWLSRLQSEFEKPYMQDLREFLKSEIQKGKKIYPKPKEYFAALNTTPYDQVKVVILGQDPYHGEGQAHGLCFSVQQGVDIPPSLLNIYKELESDMGLTRPKHGCLTQWGEQGVLLLNATLTVEANRAGSHQNKGWETFTNKIIRLLGEKHTPVVFLLWGTLAQKKEELIKGTHHLILKAPHPSPLSAHRGFLGCRHFSKANAFLTQNGMEPIDWSLTEPSAI